MRLIARHEGPDASGGDPGGRAIRATRSRRTTPMGSWTGVTDTTSHIVQPAVHKLT